MINAILRLNILVLLVLGGCASINKQATSEGVNPVTAPAGGTSQSAPPHGEVPPAEVLPLSPPVAVPENAPPEPAPKAAASNNRAVIALLNRARVDSLSGQNESAGASLERALRIEPRNPWLWHELAQLRQAQGKYAQAISLAQKSSSFAGNDRRLLAQNWRVIGNARIAQGNPVAAELAFKHAIELEP
jgi:tetratricopeptide (TPR) repeat protein